MPQRSVVGLTATKVSSGIRTDSSRTTSVAPHSPGPINTGNGVNCATAASRSSQADGPITAGGNTGPCNSGAGASGNADDAGSPDGWTTKRSCSGTGRGRGSGVSATAMLAATLASATAK